MDTIHVISPGGVLPNGTPVTLFLSLHLGGALSAVPVTAGGSTVNARASLDGIGVSDFLFIHDHFLTPAAAHTVSGNYATVVGANLPVGATMVAAVGPQNGDEIADAFNTGLFAMDILTPGASYTSESGTVFATSIQSTPEPASFVLVGISLALAVCQRKSRIS